MYYGDRFTERNELVNAITDYIDYYINGRLQRKLRVMTPMAYHNLYISSIKKLLDINTRLTVKTHYILLS